MAVGAHWGMVHCNIEVQFTEDEDRNLSISLAPPPGETRVSVRSLGQSHP